MNTRKNLPSLCPTFVSTRVSWRLYYCKRLNKPAEIGFADPFFSPYAEDPRENPLIFFSYSNDVALYLTEMCTIHMHEATRYLCLRLSKYGPKPKFQNFPLNYDIDINSYVAPSIYFCTIIIENRFCIKKCNRSNNNCTLRE